MNVFSISVTKYSFFMESLFSFGDQAMFHSPFSFNKHRVGLRTGFGKTNINLGDVKETKLPFLNKQKNY